MSSLIVLVAVKALGHVSLLRHPHALALWFEAALHGGSSLEDSRGMFTCLSFTHIKKQSTCTTYTSRGHKFMLEGIGVDLSFVFRA